MPENHLIYGFTAGEVSPEFYGRTDLTKYPLGAAQVRNFFVDYKGALVSRPGSRFVGRVADDNSEYKLFRFRATGGDYVLEFGDSYMRVIYDGGYILEAADTITGISQANPAVVTAANSYSNGDKVFIDSVAGMTEVNGKYYLVAGATGANYQLTDLDGNNINSTGYTAYSSGGESSRVYTLVTPYAGADLKNLRAEQDRLVIRLTHTVYKPRTLTFVAAANWTLALITSGSSMARPTGLAHVSRGAAGTAGAVYAVTAVAADGSESLPSDYHFATTITNFTQVEGSLRLNWNVVPDAVEYFIYRSVVMTDENDLSASQEVGYIGRCRGTQFIDSNIIADFTKTPPINRDPWADLSVQYITVTAGGAGYDNTSTVTVTGGGSGFVGYPVVDLAGTVVGVVVLNGGSGYTAPVVSFAGPGAGATATATVSPATNNNPRAFKRFQQRGVYAGTRNNPMVIEGSKPGELDNHDVGTIVNAGDAYTFTLDVDSTIPIRHLLALKSGLLAFTDISIEQLRAEEGKAISAINALAEPQAYKGASLVEPIKIDLDILFTQDILGNLIAMSFTQYTNSYSLQDLTILASHLFKPGNEITFLTYAEEPHKIVYCIREDGSRLQLTYLRDQEVFAWATDYTKGKYENHVTVLEGEEAVVYQVVERKLAGGTHKYVERVARRTFDHDEDCWAVDCGLDFPLNTLAESITPAAATGTGINFALSGAPTGISVDDILYVGGGKAKVTALPGGSALTCDWLRDMTDVQQEDPDNTPNTQASGDWTWATPTLTVSGLDHLEGELVSVLADGDALLDKLVTNGAITLDLAATKIVVGLPYRCRVETLDVSTNSVLVEGRQKAVAGIAIRTNETRGLTVGNSFDEDKQHSMRDRTDEDWGEPINPRSEISMQHINGGWDRHGHVFMEQRWPLPASILGYVLTVELGDL